MQSGAEFLDWIGALPTEIEDKLSECSISRSFRAGERIINKDDISEGVYRLNAGRVKIYVSSADGEEFIIKEFAPPESFGELSAIDSAPYPFTAEAITDVEVRFISSNALSQLREECPEINAALIQTLLRSLRSSMHFIERTMICSMENRIAGRIFWLTEGARQRGEEPNEIKISQSDLAAMTGLSRQVVNRTLAKFQESGVIERKYAGLLIKNLPELERLADPNYLFSD